MEYLPGRDWKPYERDTCRDCSVLEGENHTPNCFQELCPFCLGQLVTCDCSYTKLEVDHSEGTWAYENGLTEQQLKQWTAILERAGLVPYWKTPNLCARCGETWPAMFTADDWQLVIPPQYAKRVLCRQCFEFVKAVTVEAASKSDA